MRSISEWGCLVAVLLQPGLSDIYLHCPPGSNNRLNGEGTDVTTNNRLFDSQNNNKAGYNVGDKLPNKDTSTEVNQLPQEFFMSGCYEKAKTEVDIMWTNQHGTGRDADKYVESQVILQYMCQPFPDPLIDVNTQFKHHTIRNGVSTSRQGDVSTNREIDVVSRDVGLHEPYYYYQAYLRRERNKGLFTADQALPNSDDKPIYTRQNKGGARSGYEVPEERDYYPYWGPAPWKDIAIMVSDEKTLKLMETHVNSADYGYKYMCIMTRDSAGNNDCPLKNDNNHGERCVAKYLTERACKQAGGKWIRFITNVIEKTSGVLSTCEGVGDMQLKKGVPYEPQEVSQGAEQLVQYVLVQKPPEVVYAPPTYVNHNGVTTNGKFSSYKWRVPCFPSNVTQRCVLRIRYNITTDDVPRHFDADDNSKVKNNPKTKASDGHTDLQLALNTAQVGRTFQDRTHVFLLKPRSQLPEKYQRLTIKYIFGMGKRGNIVQTYPAMEYRFFPEVLHATTDDVVCFVWSGSNHNPSGYDGQGDDQTDRTNVCWVSEGCSSLKPKTCHEFPLEVVEKVDKFDAHSLNLHLNKGCFTDSNVDAELKNAPASCNPPCFRMKVPGEYCYMSTRNNNFSNRRHVGKIIVESGSQLPTEKYGEESHPGLSCKDIRRHTKTNKNGVYWISLRKGCSAPLGMKDGTITDAQITASSSSGSPHQARPTNSGWQSATSDQNQWLQVDFGKKTDVTKIKTWGTHGHYYIKTYTLSYSEDGSNFKPYQNKKNFQGNVNPTDGHLNVIEPAIRARYIRIHPTSWHSHIIFTVEFFGCSTGAVTPFKVFCDMEAGGWTMVFKAVGGVDKDVYDVYKSDQTSSENKEEALNVRSDHKDHYKNRIILNWKTFHPSEARVGLYKRGQPKFELLKELKFDAEGSDNKNWFSASKLTHSPYSDTPKESDKYDLFSIEGDQKLNRRFIINRSNGACEKAVGWMMIGGQSCDWEKSMGKTAILYSTQKTSTSWSNTHTVGKADVLVVFLR